MSGINILVAVGILVGIPLIFIYILLIIKLIYWFTSKLELGKYSGDDDEEKEQ